MSRLVLTSRERNLMPAIRVLVADDASDLRGVVRMLLDLEDDFEVVAEAGTGVEAVRLSREHQPDLIVLDLAMPVMDGLTALTELRAVAPEAKVVMFSAHDAPSKLEEARDRGAVGFIDKGSGMVDLVGRLRSICLPG
jgi:DNA-binding NarL/FixJ family response regulator